MAVQRTLEQSPLITGSLFGNNKRVAARGETASSHELVTDALIADAKGLYAQLNERFAKAIDQGNIFSGALNLIDGERTPQFKLGG